MTSPSPTLPPSSLLASPPPRRAELLQLVGARTSLELAGFVIPGVLLWSVPRDRPTTVVWTWACGYWIAAALVALARRRFRADASSLSAQAFEDRWSTRLERTALAMGLLWGGLTWAAVPVRSFEYGIFVYLVLAATTASTAAFASADLRVFGRFIGAKWTLAVLAAPWVFPSQWPAIVPLAILYPVLVWRHGRTAHGFLVEQARLKERSQELAAAHRAAREAADAASASKSRFLATASHDLRQPLYALALTAHAAIQRNRDEALHPLLKDLADGARQVNELLDALLDLSSLEAGLHEIRKEPVGLPALLQELHGRFGVEARDRRLGWRLRLPASVASVASAPTVMADPVLLRRALANLLHNALRYTPRGGVLLACRRVGASWAIDVVDTGIGIPLDRQARVFDQGERVAEAAALARDGHGLGLAVVSECARRLDATVVVVSTPGRGSRFRLMLPACEPTVPAGLDPARPSGPASGLGQAARTPPRLSGRVLLIEDDAAVATAVARVLTDAGLVVHAAASAREAGQVCDLGVVPDVILSDLRLGDGASGLEALATLLERFPQSRGCLVTGDWSSPELARAEDEGFLVLRKPVQPERLLTLLERWLDSVDAT